MASLVSEGRLVWMAAHQPMATVGENKRSDRVRVTLNDWRANSLVDALAKVAAQSVLTTKGMVYFLKSATTLARNQLGNLAQAIYAANHHRVEEVDDYDKVTHTRHRNPMLDLLRLPLTTRCGRR